MIVDAETAGALLAPAPVADEEVVAEATDKPKRG